MTQPLCVERFCPICGYDKKEVLYTRHFAAFQGVSFLTTYDVVCCDKCGGVYADNIPNQEDFEKYYEENSKYEQLFEQRLSDSLYDSNAELLVRGLTDKNSSILDVGCGNGHLLAALKRQGYKNLKGVEPSFACAQYVKTEYGIPCVEGSFSQMSLLDNTTEYDAVILHYTLEHIVNVYEVIEAISKMINSKGLLFIGVPNLNDFNPEVNGPYQEFSTEHINYFCLESLQNMLGIFGFELVLLDLCRQGRISCVFRKSGHIRRVKKETHSKKCINAYIKKSADLDSSIAKIITNAVSDDGNKLIVWGTGTLTLHLLATGILSANNIRAFVDSNPHYIDGAFNKIPVIAPETLTKYNEPILISSFDWHDEILNIIKNKLSLKNQVISINGSTRRIIKTVKITPPP